MVNWKRVGSASLRETYKMAAPPTRRGQEFAAKADLALREGRLEEARTCHKHAWTAFKEARDALLEGDTNTKMALKILIDYHRDREKNPGDPKHILPKPSSSATTTLRQIQSPETVPPLGVVLDQFITRCMECCSGSR